MDARRRSGLPRHACAANAVLSAGGYNLRLALTLPSALLHQILDAIMPLFSAPTLYREPSKCSQMDGGPDLRLSIRIRTGCLSDKRGPPARKTPRMQLTTHAAERGRDRPQSPVTSTRRGRGTFPLQPAAPDQKCQRSKCHQQGEPAHRDGFPRRNGGAASLRL